jgi:hypothetical protein
MVFVVRRDYRKRKESFPSVGVNLERLETELVGVLVLPCLKLLLGGGKHSGYVFFSIWRAIGHHRPQYAKKTTQARYFPSAELTRKSLPSLILFKVSSSLGSGESYHEQTQA